MLGACARAKIELITIWNLRRTFGTRLGENNVNTATIAKLLGHGDYAVFIGISEEHK
jgi:integrase